MDLDELRAFLVVVETGSMLGAATRLGLPRGTLRRRVDALEARAGVSLLERSARGVSVTPAGTVLAERGRALIEDGAALLSAARELGQQPLGRLCLRLSVGLPPAMLELTELLRSALPNPVEVTLEIRDQPFARPLDGVDIVAAFSDQDQPKGWTTLLRPQARLRVLASPAYFEEHERPASPAELRDHRLLAWSGPGVDPRRWPLHAGGSIEVAPALIANDAHLLRQRVEGGAMLGLLPDTDLDLLGIRRDDLAPVLDTLVGRQLPAVIAVRDTLLASPKHQRVLETFAAVLERWTS